MRVTRTDTLCSASFFNLFIIRSKTNLLLTDHLKNVGVKSLRNVKKGMKRANMESLFDPPKTDKNDTQYKLAVWFTTTVKNHCEIILLRPQFSSFP